MSKKAMIAASLLAALTVTAVAIRGNVDSGLKVGEMVSAFHPTHVVGPHKGTDACPPCTYGNTPAVRVWVNGDNAENVANIAKLLDKRVGKWNSKNFVAFVIYVTDSSTKGSTVKQIEDVAAKSGAKIAMAWIDKGNDGIKDYNINTSSEVKNTVLVYNKRMVANKFVNFKADEKGLAQLNAAIDGITK